MNEVMVTLSKVAPTVVNIGRKGRARIINRARTIRVIKPGLRHLRARVGRKAGNGKPALRARATLKIVRRNRLIT